MWICVHKKYSWTKTSIDHPISWILIQINSRQQLLNAFQQTNFLSLTSRKSYSKALCTFILKANAEIQLLQSIISLVLKSHLMIPQKTAAFINIFTVHATVLIKSVTGPLSNLEVQSMKQSLQKNKHNALLHSTCMAHILFLKWNK